MCAVVYKLNVVMLSGLTFYALKQIVGEGHVQTQCIVSLDLLPSKARENSVGRSFRLSLFFTGQTVLAACVSKVPSATVRARRKPRDDRWKSVL